MCGPFWPFLGFSFDALQVFPSNHTAPILQAIFINPHASGDRGADRAQPRDRTWVQVTTRTGKDIDAIRVQTRKLPVIRAVEWPLRPLIKVGAKVAYQG